MLGSEDSSDKRGRGRAGVFLDIGECYLFRMTWVFEACIDVVDSQRTYLILCRFEPPSRVSCITTREEFLDNLGGYGNGTKNVLLGKKVSNQPPLGPPFVIEDGRKKERKKEKRTQVKQEHHF